LTSPHLPPAVPAPPPPQGPSLRRARGWARGRSSRPSAWPPASSGSRPQQPDSASRSPRGPLRDEVDLVLIPFPITFCFHHRINPRLPHEQEDPPSGSSGGRTFGRGGAGPIPATPLHFIPEGDYAPLLAPKAAWLPSEQAPHLSCIHPHTDWTATPTLHKPFPLLYVSSRAASGACL